MSMLKAKSALVRVGLGAVALLFALLSAISCLPGGGTPGQFSSFFVYTANGDTNDVSILQAAPEGRLVFLDKVAAGTTPSDIASYAAANAVYVSNMGSNTISVFKIGGDGRLTLVRTMPTGSMPRYIARSSGFLIVSCIGEDHVLVYSLDDEENPQLALTLSVPGPGKGTFSIYGFFVPSSAENKLYWFDTDGTPMSPATIDTGSVPIVDADALTSVFVLNSDSNSLSLFFTSQSNIWLGDTFNMPPDPTALGIWAGTQNAYVTSRGSQSISHISFGSVTGAQPPTGPNPTAIAFFHREAQPAIDVAYVTDQNGTIRLYSLDNLGNIAYVDSYDTHGTGVNGVATSFAFDVPLIITTTTLPSGTVGVPYSADLEVTGGIALKAAHFTLQNGSLPPGLHFDETTTEEGDRYTKIDGTPTQAGTFNFTVTASQPGLTSDPVSLSITIAASGGGGGDESARFMNAIPDSTNATLKIDSTTIASSLGYPFMSDPVNISALTDGGQHTLELTTTPSGTWNGTSSLASGNSFAFFGVGSIGDQIKVARRTLPLDYAIPAGKVLVTIVDGYTAAPVDFYVLPSGDTPNGTNKTATLSFQQTLKLQPEIDAGTYKIFATTQGDPNDILAQSSAIPLPDGKFVDYVLVSSVAQGTTFITTFEN